MGCFFYVFNLDAVRGQVTCKVGQIQQWVADCRRAGPGVLAAESLASMYGTNMEYSPNGLHMIAFISASAWSYTLEVTYNGHVTQETHRYSKYCNSTI